MSPLRIATRRSPLALWQAHEVARQLAPILGARTVEFVAESTEGDRNLGVPISALGGKGVFAKDVQQRVLDGRADIAVHSAKDLQSVTPDGLKLCAVPQRGDHRDALVGTSLAQLGPGAVVATGSNRRRLQIQAHRPDLRVVGLRGNIATRLGRLSERDPEPVSAVVAAAAALERLEITEFPIEVLEPEIMLPQVGQGALAIECRDGDDVASLVAQIEHRPSRLAVDAERAFLAELGGDCDLPAAAWATVEPDATIQLRGLLFSRDEANSAHATRRGHDPEALGRDLATSLQREV